MKKIYFIIGVIVGAILFGNISVATNNIIAQLSEQPIYVDGEKVEMLTYHIDGNNFVRLRDIGRAVDFRVTFDQTTGNVHIDSNSSYLGDEVFLQARLYYLRFRSGFISVSQQFPDIINNAEYIWIDLSGMGFEHMDVLEGMMGNFLEESGFTIVPYASFDYGRILRIRMFEIMLPGPFWEYEWLDDGIAYFRQLDVERKDTIMNIAWAENGGIAGSGAVFELRDGIWTLLD